MTSPAAISGTFEAKKHAYRQTQDGVVISFVLHPNDVSAAFAVCPLGTPFELKYTALDYDNPEQPAVAKQTKTPYRDWPASRQAGYWCKQESFQKWAIGTIMMDNDPALAEQRTAEFLYDTFGISSRRELDTNDVARQQWKALSAKFEQDTGRMAVQHG